MKTAAEEAFDILTRMGDSSLSEAILDKACMDKMLKDATETKVEFLIDLIKLENTMSDIKIAARCEKAKKDKMFLEKALSKESCINREDLILASISGNILEFLSEKGFIKASEALRGGLWEFEKYTDNEIFEYVKTASGVTFGIEPVIAYLYRKQSEIQTLRVILNAKYNKIQENEIRVRLREI